MPANPSSSLGFCIPSDLRSLGILVCGLGHYKTNSILQSVFPQCCDIKICVPGLSLSLINWTLIHLTYLVLPDGPFLLLCVFNCSYLNVPAMQDAAQFLLGTHDFSTFRSLNSETPFHSPIRTILQADIRPSSGFLSHHYEHR